MVTQWGRTVGGWGVENLKVIRLGAGGGKKEVARCYQARGRRKLRKLDQSTIIVRLINNRMIPGAFSLLYVASRNVSWYLSFFISITQLVKRKRPKFEKKSL